MMNGYFGMGRQGRPVGNGMELATIPALIR